MGEFRPRGPAPGKQQLEKTDGWWFVFFYVSTEEHRFITYIL